MTKEEFIGDMRDCRARWDALLAEVDNDQAVVPGVAGHWSLKDIIAHVTAYERGVVEWLEGAARGQALVFPDLDQPDVDGRNALLWERSQPLSLAEVRREAARVYKRLLELVRGLSEAELTDPARAEWFVIPRWGQSRPLWQCIADDSFHHYDQHMPGIQAWLAQVRNCEGD